MNNFITKSPFLLLIGAFIFIAGCKKEEDNLVLPDQLGANAGEPLADSLLITTSTIAEDSFNTLSLPYKLLGAMNDPEFGTSKSEVYSQFTITDLKNKLNEPGNILDSAVLNIRYTSKIAFYGNLNSVQSFTVHRLTENFPNTTTIYSNQSLAYDPTPIATFNGSISLGDSTTIRSGNNLIKIAPSLKLKLTNAFASDLFNAPDGTYATDAAFKDFFKGIVIKAISNPASGEGAVFALSIDDNLSKISIHYNDSLQYSLNMKSSKSFANYSIISQSSNISAQKANPGIDYSELYLQSLTGAKVQITIPNLTQFTSGKLKVIHKAELIIKAKANSFNSTYYLPQRLLVLQPDDNGRSIAIPDLFTGKFNGNLRTGNEYILNITDFMQFQVNQAQNNAAIRNQLHIVIPNSDPIAPSRMIIDANKGAGNVQIALRVVYSEP